MDTQEHYGTATLEPHLEVPPPPRAEEEVSTGRLIRDLFDDAMMLVREEVNLARTEMQEKISIFSRNAAYVGIGAFVAYAGVLVLLAAASIGLYVLLQSVLAYEVAVWLAPLIVGAVVTLVGYILVQKAITTMKHTKLTPHETAESMRENKEWLKHEMT